MENHAKKQFVAVALAAFSLVSISASEKVQIQGSTSIELPKPRHSLEEIRQRGTDQGPGGRSQVDGGFAPPPVQSNVPVDRKLKEMIDKKRNWMFVNPYKEQFDSKTEEFLKGEKSTGLFGHRLMQDEESSVMEDYLKEGKRDAETGERVDPRRNDPAGNQSRLQELAAPGEADGTSEHRGLFNAETATVRPFEPRAIVGDNSPFQQRLEGNRFSESPIGGVDRSALGSSPADFRKEREQRNLELNQLFQSRTLGEAGAGGLATAPVAGRLDLNPIGGARPQVQPGGLGRLDFGSGPARTSPVFTGPPTAFGGGPSVGSRGPAVDFSPRLSQPSGIAPAQSVAPRDSGRQGPAAAPFVLPLPKRKF